MMIKIVAFSVFLVCVSAVRLPKYIKTCKAHQPTINECALRNAREALSDVLKGDKNLKLPNLLPVVVPLAEGLASSDKLKFTFHNLHVYGLEHLEINKLDIDLKAHTVHFNAHMDYFTFHGPYVIKGQILILPIQGKGDCNITLLNGEYDYSFDYNAVEKRGKTFMKLGHPKMTFDVKGAYYHMTGLFNGDQRLGDHMNLFLNENWPDVTEEIKGAVIGIMEPIVTRIVTTYLESVPINEIFSK